jgi:hypothetical protein
MIQVSYNETAILSFFMVALKRRNLAFGLEPEPVGERYEWAPPVPERRPFTRVREGVVKVV